jgi:hypothetical protein
LGAKQTLNLHVLSCLGIVADMLTCTLKQVSLGRRNILAIKCKMGETKSVDKWCGRQDLFSQRNKHHKIRLLLQYGLLAFSTGLFSVHVQSADVYECAFVVWPRCM